MPVPKPMKIMTGEDNFTRWQDFKESFQDYALVDKLFKDPPEIQLAKFRTIFGEDNRSVLRNLDLARIETDVADPSGLAPCGQLKNIISALDKRFTTHRNIIYQRYLLYRTKQTSGESTKDFFERLSKQAKKCDFGSASKLMLRDMLVLGTSYAKAQEACIRKDHSKLDAQGALRIIEMFEDNEKTVKTIQEQQSVPSESANVVKTYSAEQLVSLS